MVDIERKNKLIGTGKDRYKLRTVSNYCQKTRQKEHLLLRYEAVGMDLKENLCAT